MYALSTMTNIYIRKEEFDDICLIFQTEKWLGFFIRPQKLKIVCKLYNLIKMISD